MGVCVYFGLNMKAGIRDTGKDSIQTTDRVSKGSEDFGCLGGEQEKVGKPQ